MPITTSARKKMRQDKKRRLTNLKTLSALKKALTNTRKTPSAKNLKSASSIIDRAVKKGVIHRNKADRLKSRLSKRVGFKEKKPVKKSLKTGRKGKGQKT